MTYTKAFLLSTFLLLGGAARAQLQVADTLIVEAYIGGSAALSHGSFIDYHEGFADVKDPNTTFASAVKPMYFGTIGGTVVYAPFCKADTKLSNLAFSVGLGYIKSGFTHSLTSVYTSPVGDLRNQTTYTTRYTMNYLIVPFTIRYGKRCYAEISYMPTRILGTRRTRTVQQEVTGQDAYAGGFNSEGDEKERIDKSVLNKRHKEWTLGVGLRLSKGVSIKAQCLFSRDLLKWSQEWKTITPQLQLIFPLYRNSFFQPITHHAQ